MKYPAIKKENEQVLHIDPIKTGVNLTTLPYFAEGDLSDCKNVVFSGGSLKTRQGIYAEPNNVVRGEYSDQEFGSNYCFTDSTVVMNGTEYRIATESAEIGFDSYAVMVFFVSSSKEVINGRGNKYEVFHAENYAFTGKPTVLEAPNLLSGSFHAYYSSDGYSSSFTLPFTNISENGIHCRIHSAPNEHTDWTVYDNSTSATEKFMNVEVTMNVDRSKGLVYFTLPDGQDYSVPLMSRYLANNIRITATKKTPVSFEDVVSCTCAVVSDSRIMLSGGLKGNRVFIARYDNPLYIPQSDPIELGEERLPVTAIVPFGEKLLAFKKNELYVLNLKKGGAVNTQSLLADNDAVFYNTDSITAKKTSYGTGCENRRAVTVLKDKAVWLSPEGIIYAMTASLNIMPISQKVHSVLDSFDSRLLKTAVAINDKRHCMFFFENIALTCKISSNPDEENTAWYIWRFPKNLKIIGGIDKTTPFIYCVNKFNTCYTAELKGDRDCLITYSADNAHKEELPISSSISTAFYAPLGKNIKKKLNKICMQLSAKGSTEIKINGKRLDLGGLRLSGDEDFRKLTVFPPVSSFSSVYITISSEEFLNLGELDIYYNKLI